MLFQRTAYIRACPTSQVQKNHLTKMEWCSITVNSYF